MSVQNGAASALLRLSRRALPHSCSVCHLASYGLMIAMQMPAMPKTKICFFREDDGTIPFLEWLAELEKPGERLRWTPLVAHKTTESHSFTNPNS